MSTPSFIRENAPWLSAGFLLTFLSSFGQTFFISIFAGEIREGFSLSHGQWGGIYSLGTGISAIVMVWAGGLTDRYRVRGLGGVCIGLLVVASLFMALNPVWWLLVPIIFLLRFAGQGMLGHIAVVAMARWFTATRGKALSLAAMGFSLGEALLPVLFVALMTVLDWRILWIIAACVVAMGIPTLRRLLQSERTPQSIAEHNSSTGMNALHWTRSGTIKHWLFWFMVPTLLGPSAFSTAFFFHQVHFAEVKNVAHLQLVAMFPLYTVVAIGSVLLSGWALDKVGTPRLIPFLLLPMVVAFVVFSYANSGLSLMVGFVFLGLTAGANSTLPSAFWAEFYGARNIGSIKAMAAAIMVLGSAIGPGITGYGIDHGYGLEQQFLFIAGYFGLASILMMIGIARAKVLLPTPL